MTSDNQQELDQFHFEVLYLCSNNAGMDFPTATNIAGEYDERVEQTPGFASLKQQVYETLWDMEEKGLVEDRETHGSSFPYQPTPEGEELLRENTDLYQQVKEE